MNTDFWRRTHIKSLGLLVNTVRWDEPYGPGPRTETGIFFEGPDGEAVDWEDPVFTMSHGLYAEAEQLAKAHNDIVRWLQKEPPRVAVPPSVLDDSRNVEATAMDMMRCLRLEAAYLRAQGDVLALVQVRLALATAATPRAEWSASQVARLTRWLEVNTPQS